jgi:hypothetical protein
MSVQKNSRVVETKFVPIQAPCLESVIPDEIYRFLKEFERYKKATVKEQLLGLFGCTDETLLEVLRGRYPKELADEAKYKDFLEEKILFKSPEQALSELSRLRVDPLLAGSSGLNCVVQYDMEFARIQKRLKNMKIQDKVLLQYYVKGFSSIPEIYRKLTARLVCEDQTLSSMQLAASSEMEDYALRSLQDHVELKLGEVKVDVHQSDAPKDVTAVRANGNKASVYELRKEAGLCKYCGEKWSKAHFEACPERVKKVHAVSSLLNSNLPEFHATDGIVAKPINLWVGGIKLSATRDSAADVSCISRHLVEKLKVDIPIKSHDTMVRLQMADGRRIPTRVHYLPGCSVLHKQSDLVNSASALSCDSDFCVYELPDDVNDTLLLGNNWNYRLK